MNNINEILKSIGLTSTEVTIYTAGLAYDFISVNELEKQTQIKRTTIYHSLDTLMNKGLAAKKGTESKYVFSMSNPENINKMLDAEIDNLQNKKDNLNKIIPLLKQKIKETGSGFKILHYEGVSGVKLSIEEALYCKSREWNIIAPYRNFFSELSLDYAKYFMQTRNERQIKARSLWEGIFDKKVLSSDDIKKRNPRFLPKGMKGKFKSVIIIFDDKVLIISSLAELSSILIHSKEINATFNTIFEGLWSVSKEYSKIVQVK